jgi:hypothetical protein
MNLALGFRIVEVRLAEPPTNAKTATLLRAQHQGKRQGAISRFVRAERLSDRISFLPWLRRDDPCIWILCTVSSLFRQAQSSGLDAARAI